MKKTILTLAVIGAVSSVFAQGTLNFSTRVSGTVIGHVYGTAVGETSQKSGNTATETPVGTQTYAGVLLAGSGFSAQLFGGTLGTLEANLVSVSAISTFRTGTTLGGTPSTQTLNIAAVPPGGSGTFQVRAWDNVGGTITSWDLATIRGKSDLFTVGPLGDGGLALPADMANFRSFNIYAVPEPATFALAGLGAAALLIFRRRK